MDPRLLILLASLMIVQHTNAIPYLAVTPSRSQKCVVVPWPKGAKLKVEYEFFEYDMGRDSIEIIIRPNVSDDDFYTDDMGLHSEKESRTMNYRVPKKSGSLEYIAEGGFELDVCVNGNPKGSKRMIRPLLVSLKLIESGKLAKDDFSLEFLAEKEEEKEQDKLKQKQNADQKEGHAHLTYTEKTIYNLLREAGLVQGNAEVQKKAEAKFFQKSKDLHASIKMWPIIHLLVLLVTGFINAKYMVGFLKSRRVI